MGQFEYRGPFHSEIAGLNPMLDINIYFDEIDIARVRRAKELSEIKRSFGALLSSDPLGIASKAVVVSTYANWEGFYNECVRTYLNFLREKGGRVRDSDWMLLLSAFHADFESMRDRTIRSNLGNSSLKTLRNDWIVDLMHLTLLSLKRVPI